MAGNENSGRKSKDDNTRVIQKTITEAGKLAIQEVFYSLRGTDGKGRKVKPISGTRVRLCELALAHAIGLPRQKVDIHHTGDLMTLTDLAKLAKEYELGQFKTVEDTKELAPVEGKNEQN